VSRLRTREGGAARTRPIQSQTVSIIMPVGGTAAGVSESLQSIARLDPMPIEVIVVVDGINLSVTPLVQAINGKLLTLSECRGPAAARNAGAREATGDLLFFVDADVEVPPDAVATVLEVFADDPDIAAVFGSYDEAPGDPRFLSQYRNLLHHYVHQNGREDASTFWGACGVVRRPLFHEVGGYQESFTHPCIEDIELGSRLRRAGHRIRLLKNLKVKHLKGWTMATMLKTDLFDRAVPWTELMLREGHLLNDLNVNINNRLSVLTLFLGFGSLVFCWLWPPLVFIAILAPLTLLFLNFALYRFYAARRGLGFMFAAVFWHWVYLFICGIGFIIGAMRHYSKQWRS